MVHSSDALDFISSLHLPQIHKDIKADLIKEVTELQVKNALFSIQAEKALGPDGFNAKFYQANWDVVGQDLRTLVKAFFSSGHLLRAWNSTAITLVPKIKHPIMV